MSYDLSFDCEIAEPHYIAGGTYAVDGTTDAYLNITYNYAPFFHEYLCADQGLRSLYGLTAQQVIEVLEQVIPRMSGQPHSNYWEATEGNAKKALEDLLELAKLCPPNAVLSGD